MSVCIYSVFVLSGVGNGLSQGVLSTVYKINNFRTNSEWERTKRRRILHCLTDFCETLYMKHVIRGTTELPITCRDRANL
jgi:hypothetical protein